MVTGSIQPVAAAAPATPAAGDQQAAAAVAGAGCSSGESGSSGARAAMDDDQRQQAGEAAAGPSALAAAGRFVSGGAGQAPGPLPGGLIDQLMEQLVDIEVELEAGVGGVEQEDGDSSDEAGSSQEEEDSDEEEGESDQDMAEGEEDEGGLEVCPALQSPVMQQSCLLKCMCCYWFTYRLPQPGRTAGAWNLHLMSPVSAAYHVYQASRQLMLLKQAPYLLVVCVLQGHPAADGSDEGVMGDAPSLTDGGEDSDEEAPHGE